MRNILPFLVLAGVAACSLAEDAVTITEAPDLEQSAVWNGSLTGSNGGISGTATIAEYRAYFNASVTLAGAAANTAYQWRIFAGTCATPGAQFGPAQAYPDVTTNGSGAASIERLLAGALIAESEYNVRFSTVATTPVIVACGNLTRS